jgi:Smg protein
MFDILVYLYETYYRPDACPEPAALARKLSAVGFDDVEISEALVWLTDLNAMAGVEQTLTASSTGTRFYVKQESDVLGTAAIGFIQFLEAPRCSPLQREIVIERARARRGARLAGQAQSHRADAAGARARNRMP